MQPGQVIGGKYRLLRLLGDGGMGAVYEAHHEVLGARVAIKVLHEDLARKPELVDRFLREARVLAQIASPHVVRVLDIAVPDRSVSDGGTAAYIVMELLSGESLSALVARERRLPIAVAVDFASQVLEALAAAHALGVVHRDLKPENILVAREGERSVVKVIDFGIAKALLPGGAPSNLTVAGALMGTPEYMAPEQAHSADRADARSDVFSVGVLLYEMLSGARPVEGEDPRMVTAKVERGDVVPLIHRVPGLPRDLAGLVHRAMAPRPELRFPTANEMRLALQQVTGHGAEVVRRRSSPPSALLPAPAEARASGTMMGRAVDAAPVASSGSQPPAHATDPGAPIPVDVYAPAYPHPHAQAGQGQGGAPPAWASPPGGPQGAAQGAPAYGPPPGNPARGGRRGAGPTVWLLGAMALLLVGGVAAALVLAGDRTAKPRPAPSGVPSSPPTAPLAAVTDAGLAAVDFPDADFGPLPATTATTPHAVVGPAPRGSSSGAPTAPASAPPLASGVPPFGLPPFTLPSGLPSSFPNPFPLPAASGVGPVITIPTTFPPFGFPSDPAPPAPSTPPSRRGAR